MRIWQQCKCRRTGIWKQSERRRARDSEAERTQADRDLEAERTRTSGVSLQVHDREVWERTHLQKKYVVFEVFCATSLWTFCIFGTEITSWDIICEL